VILFAAAPAAAVELQVYPVRFVLEPAAPTATMTIRNRGTDDAALQLTLYAWSQVAGQDQLDPTRDVLANPALFLLKGGNDQLARFGLRVPVVAVERSYRVIVQEVPRQRASNGLVTLLRMSIPIFVPPEKPVTGVEWRLRTGARGVELIVRNTGNVHVQIRGLKLTAAGSPAVDKPLSVYVLPGSTVTFPFAFGRSLATGVAVALSADTDQGAFAANVRAETAVDAPGQG
jgi:fimbrial chaperone protein